MDLRNNFQITLKPLLILWRIFGLVSFNFNSNKYQSNKIQVFYNCSLIVLLVVVCLQIDFNMAINNVTARTPNKIIIILMAVGAYFGVISHLLIISAGIFKRNQVIFKY